MKWKKLREKLKIEKRKKIFFLIFFLNNIKCDRKYMLYYYIFKVAEFSIQFPLVILKEYFDPFDGAPPFEVV